MYTHSSITELTIEGKKIFFKRDDLLHTEINGNKARKFYSLLTNPPSIKTLKSAGGNQSNAMLALARIANYNRWSFHYLTPTIPLWLKNAPQGNLLESLNCHMILHETPKHQWNEMVTQFSQISSDTLYLPQGGACEYARHGCQLLAHEIQEFNNTLPIVIASGTGTTAYYTACYTSQPIITLACVGSKEYLYQQMSQIGIPPLNLTCYDLKIHHPFAQPQSPYYNLYETLYSKEIELDLLYDIPTLYSMLHSSLSTFIFVVGGGKEGNFTMKQRYQRFFDRNQSKT